jgi:CRISPR-associated endonuclease/helicase Cas3
MQEKTFAIVKAPGVYVVEAPMGMGKTEAALWAAYQLLVSGTATGIYFALPTQVTSNRMHLRMNEFVRRICRTSNASRLIHSNSWLTIPTAELLPVATSPDSVRDDARIGRNWFNSAKRALIAPFGVGTIDQALLGIVAAKHFFVRHFALAGKVVILDEIHSYDLYTGTLIDKLITTLESLGCTVIILSATLIAKRRSQIITHSEDVKGEDPYPLIIGRNECHTIESAAVTPPKSRTVRVDFVATETAAEEVIQIARKGGAVLWICNTVDTAQEQYQKFIGLSHDEFPIGLIHSRFPYWRREELEKEWMERFGKSGTTRCGSIFVSTQVVEQSVDLDADILITELAPTDMLLQRLGRLWRHERKNRPVDRARFCIIKEKKNLEAFRMMEAKDIVAVLGGKVHVYDPFVLLKTFRLWENYSEVIIPTQIRELIEATYCEHEDDPPSWKKLFEDRFVRDSNKRFQAAMNSNYWQPQLPDAEGVQTRLNDIPTVSVVLCRSLNRREVVFIDDTSEKLGGEEFRLSTAQAIHRNLVRVPEYCFDKIKSCAAFADYIFGKQSVGIVAENGTVEMKGFKNGTKLFYSNQLGLVIEQSS